MKTVQLRIKRQASCEASSQWEEFEIPWRHGMNVIVVLQEIARNPVNKAGQPTTAVAWDCSCLEEVCGACTMVINGKARQACTALIDHLEQPITLEPMTKFPVVRDLRVDRQRIFENLKKVHAWVPIDGTYDLGPGPRMAESQQEMAYKLSCCMSCGICMEVCPQFNENSAYMGAAIMSQVRLFNTHPTGKMNAHERLHAIMGEGGVADCGNAQNCVRACPKEIPLTTSIADMGRATTVQLLKDLLDK